MTIEGKRSAPARVPAKLRTLVFTEEYIRTMEMLNRLQDKGELDSFLERSIEWWRGFDLWEIQNQERERKGITMQEIRKAWPSLWPKSMDEDRMQAFSAFSGFFKQLDSSKLIDIIFEDCIPAVKPSTNSEDDQREVSRIWMQNQDEREQRVMERMEESWMLEQYKNFMLNDDNLGTLPRAVAPKVVPWFAQVLAAFELKAVNAPVLDTPRGFDTLVFGVSSVIVIFLLQFFGYIPEVNLDFLSQQPAPELASVRSGGQPLDWSTLDLKEFARSAPQMPTDATTFQADEQERLAEEKKQMEAFKKQVERERVERSILVPQVNSE